VRGLCVRAGRKLAAAPSMSLAGWVDGHGQLCPQEIWQSVALNSHHYLAKLLIALQVAMRIHYLV
jgi:hypothetical protein